MKEAEVDTGVILSGGLPSDVGVSELGELKADVFSSAKAVVEAFAPTVAVVIKTDGLIADA